jgi:hypothetical protein
MHATPLAARQRQLEQLAVQRRTIAPRAICRRAGGRDPRRAAKGEQLDDLARRLLGLLASTEVSLGTLPGPFSTSSAWKAARRPLRCDTWRPRGHAMSRPVATGRPAESTTTSQPETASAWHRRGRQGRSPPPPPSALSRRDLPTNGKRSAARAPAERYVAAPAASTAAPRRRDGGSARGPPPEGDRASPRTTFGRRAIVC